MALMPGRCPAHSGPQEEPGRAQAPFSWGTGSAGAEEGALHRLEEGVLGNVPVLGWGSCCCCVLIETATAEK